MASGFREAVRQHATRRRTEAEMAAAKLIRGCPHRDGICVQCLAAALLAAEDAATAAALGPFGRHRKVTGPSQRCARCDGYGSWIKDGGSPEDWSMVECLACDGTGHVPSREGA